ncbi:MAG: hypothetical protein HUU23_07475, partial [Caldilineales bacterium]|nr:hypothetical protein [Caldilineales bacterium]
MTQTHRHAAAFLAGMISTGLLLTLLVGMLLLGGCGAQPAPTPTPTKTPTVAGAEATAP